MDGLKSFYEIEDGLEHISKHDFVAMIYDEPFHSFKEYNCKVRIIVPTARQGRSQGENGNVDQFLMLQDSFTFHGRNEEGQLSNRAEQLSN